MIFKDKLYLKHFIILYLNRRNQFFMYRDKFLSLILNLIL